MKTTRLRLLGATAILAIGLSWQASKAEEGMWTLDNLPLQQLKEKYGFTPSPAWLEKIRLASTRMSDGGSGSFVSPRGLLLTNHHVALGQLQKSSGPGRDYVRDGFFARSQQEELKVPDLEVMVLVSMENVTDRVLAALKGARTPEEEFAARRSVIAEIERESLKKTGFHSEVVTLYRGGEYWLYRYKKYTDVRLVFAPEQQIAFFGGDPDNFTYPRYCLDFAFFRVYENGKPADTPNYLRWNPKGAAEGELVFVSGHPGSTQRLSTLAQLEYQRDVLIPLILKVLRHRINVLRAYSEQGPEQARQAASRIFSLENSLKAYEGRLRGLRDPRIMEKKRREEEEFRARVMANPEWRKEYGGAWDAIAESVKRAATRIHENYYYSLDSQLASMAATIVQYVVEVKKPDGERLDGYHESQLESLRFRLFSPAPIYPEMEIARIAGALELALKELGPGDPFVKTVLEGRSPREAARALVMGTKLGDPEYRRKLIEGGEKAVEESTDTMIVLARKLDPMRREYTKWVEDNVTSVQQRAGEQLGRARFAVYGKSVYPDATFTLRLSYGQVKGYPMNGTFAPPFTTLYGLYDRAHGFGLKGPWVLPERYLKGRDKLDLSKPLNFVTTNDIIGGNSGSPVINRNGEIVGVIFDGNIESLVGDYVYEEETNRAVAVHLAAITEALEKLYGADYIMRELLGR